jgi:hypothetical protein
VGGAEEQVPILYHYTRCIEAIKTEGSNPRCALTRTAIPVARASPRLLVRTASSRAVVRNTLQRRGLAYAVLYPLAHPPLARSHMSGDRTTKGFIPGVRRKIALRVSLIYFGPHRYDAMAKRIRGVNATRITTHSGTVVANGIYSKRYLAIVCSDSSIQ